MLKTPGILRSGAESKEKAVAEKLWTANFLLLWQGQLVSLLGDVVYSLALGFWVLDITGSTALMGSLMASSTLPGVLAAPFAGVIIDKCDRKRLLVAMDIIRGAAVLLLSIAVSGGYTGLWILFATGIVLSICGAFFLPAVNSSIPDIVPVSRVLEANSAMGMVQNASTLVGSSAGGFLLQLLGTPFLFLINGLSFFLSALLNSFLNIPKTKETSDKHFFADIKEGYGFVWKLRGLRLLMLTTSAANFFTFVSIVLFLPTFQKAEWLGPSKYGLALAVFSGGNVLAALVISLVRLSPSRRNRMFMYSALLSNICFILCMLLLEIFPIYLFLLAVGGFFMALLNILINTVIQLAAPQAVRGKVFALYGMVSSSMIPLGMALGGVLGEFLPPRSISLSCFVVAFMIFLPLAYSKSFRQFINAEPTEKTSD